jgi:hypothetical protein
MRLCGVGWKRRTEGYGGSAGLTLGYHLYTAKAVYFAAKAALGYHLYTAMRFISPQMRLSVVLGDAAWRRQ